jgi:osmotically-inducible protein OsmY
MKTDAELQKDVVEQLKSEPRVNASEIGVAVKDGIVTITGYVDSFDEKWHAEQAVKKVAGVRGFAEETEVRLPAFSERTDQDIAEAAANILEWTSSVPKGRVKVMVEDGRVTLFGEVKWMYQKIAAEDIVRQLHGVRGIYNQITVRSEVKPEDVKSHIEDSLKRHALLEAQQIEVETQGPKVILRGHVRSWAERNEAVWAAWAEPGVTEVEDHIGVTP